MFESDTDQDAEAIVEAFFEDLDAQDETGNESVDVMSEGEAQIEAALEQGDEPDEPDEESEEAEEPAEEDEEAEDEPDEDDEPENVWEKRFKDLQSHKDQQIAALEQRLSALDQWAQNVYQQQMAQHQQSLQAQQAPAANPLAGATKAMIPDAVKGDLSGTFQAVAAYRPDLVPATIAAAREEYGNEIGDQMQLEYNQYLIQQERAAREQQWAQQQQYIAEQEAPAQIEATMMGLIDNIANQYGESFEVIKDDFVARAAETAPAFREYMQQNGLEMTPDAIHYFLTKTVNDVREERLSQQASKPRKARKISKTEHAEGSTNGDGLRSEDMTADELAINELLAGAKELSIDISAPNR